MNRNSRSKRKWLRRIVAVAATLLALWIFSITATAAMTAGGVPTDTKTTTYTIHTGDTLWTIAARFDTRDDTRDVVDWMEARNGLWDGQALQVGETIMVPVAR